MTGQPAPRNTDLDLTRIEGIPTPHADHAYTQYKSDIEIKIKSKLLGSIEAVFRGESPVQTAFALGLPVLPASGMAWVFHQVGLSPTVDAIAAGVIYLVSVGGVIMNHRRRR